MGPCHHVKSEILIENSILGLSGDLTITLEREFLGCGDADWMFEVELQHLFLMLNSEGAAVSAIDAASGVDPYLMTTHFSFREKLGQLDRMALADLIPSLDDGFSMPVFLWELIELKALWKHILSVKDIGTMFDAVRSLAKGAPGKTLKELSNHFLATIFGWLPFSRDLVTIASKFMTVADKVNDFMLNAGKRRTLHFEKMLHPETFKPAEWFETTSSSHTLEAVGPYAPFGWCKPLFEEITYLSKQKRVISNCSYHMTLDYRYDLPDMNQGIISLLAELDHWGINVSVSDLWQVIPFSFVVDWIWNVGNWLERFDFQNVTPAVVINDCCRSIRYELKESTQFHEFVSITGSPLSAVPVSEVQATPNSLSATRVTEGYYREPGPPLPAPEDLPHFRTPKGLQWIIAMALVSQYRG